MNDTLKIYPWLRHYRSKKGHQVFLRIKIRNIINNEVPLYDYFNGKRYIISVEKQYWDKGIVTGGSYHRPVSEINNLIADAERNLNNVVRDLSDRKFQLTRHNIIRAMYSESEKSLTNRGFLESKKPTGKSTNTGSLTRVRFFPETGENIRQKSAHEGQYKREEKESIMVYWDDFVRDCGNISCRATGNSLNEYILETGDDCNVSDFSDLWLNRYFNYRIRNGYSLHKDGSNRKYYTIPTILKYLKHMRSFGNYLFYDRKLLNNQHYMRFSLRQKDSGQTLMTYSHEPFVNVNALSKKEFDWFFCFRFADMQKELARDMFVLQTWLGGLRLSEFYSVRMITLQKDSDDIYSVRFGSGKSARVSLSEINQGYILPVMQKYPEGFRIFIKTHRYNMLLKSALKAAGLDRKIKFARELINDEKPLIREYPLYEKISGKWARYCAVSIMSEAGFSEDKIKAFTGSRDPGLIRHFRQFFPDSEDTSKKSLTPEIITGPKPRDFFHIFRIKG